MPLFYRKSSLSKGMIEMVWAPVYTSRYGKARADRFVARKKNIKRRRQLASAGRKSNRCK